jgi:cob(I)alamin adenosyltransferase
MNDAHKDQPHENPSRHDSDTTKEGRVKQTHTAATSAETGKIYTRRGDRGETGLLSGRRVSKSGVRVEAYGTVDELICVLGVARSLVGTGVPQMRDALLRIQKQLMTLAALVATDEPDDWARLPPLSAAAATELEREIDAMTGEMVALDHFILPGGAPVAAQLHVCRTVCRRAERRLITLSERGPLPQSALCFVNRLSDWLFTAARYANHRLGLPEIVWSE